MTRMVAWTVWNLFLAAIPVVLGWRVARGLADRSERRGPHRLVLGLLAVLWLLFLPNTAYLVTEPRHLLFDAPWRDLTARAREDDAAFALCAAAAALFAGYAAAGLVLFTAAVRPVERALRTRPAWSRAFPLALFPLVAFGVWLGLVHRLNSWDVWTRPGRVLSSVLAGVSRPRTLVAVGAFALLLWLAHRVLDAAADGLLARARRRVAEETRR